MELELFDYDLPAGQIAQAPPAERTSARLLRLDRGSGAIAHRRVAELPAIMRPGDLLVLNDTAVVPAKLALRRAGGGRVGGLFLREAEHPSHAGGPRWLVLLNSRGRLRIGETLTAEGCPEAALTIEGRQRADGGESAAGGELAAWEVAVNGAGGDTMALLSRIGRTPLPPYIRRREYERPGDRERYQTVFASRPGAVAAPTAGLHFSGQLLDELGTAGVQIVRLTLHVGLGTFQPVRARQIEQHRMHSEWFDLPAATADAINAARRAGRRIVAVGTTSVRVLESCFDPANGCVAARSGWTDIFIFPGHQFGAVDAMLTNFHLPRSSLLMLVAAFVGRERLLHAYRQAVAAGYRFYSFGDAMLIE